MALNLGDPGDPWLIKTRGLLCMHAEMAQLLLVCVIWIVLCTVQLQLYEPALAKARLSEALTGAGTKRVDVLEHLAITGTWLGSDVLLQTAEGTGGGADDVRQGYLRGQTAAKKPESAPAKPADSERADAFRERRTAPAGTGSDDWRQFLGLDSAGGGRFVIGVVEGTIAATGKVSGIEQPVLLMIQPAVPADEPAATVIWLCGTASPPLGWQRVGPSNATNLDRERLTFPCRA